MNSSKHPIRSYSLKFKKSKWSIFCVKWLISVEKIRILSVYWKKKKSVSAVQFHRIFMQSSATRTSEKKKKKKTTCSQKIRTTRFIMPPSTNIKYFVSELMYFTSNLLSWLVPPSDLWNHFIISFHFIFSLTSS